MKKRWNRVAWPTRTSSTPVAKGSSVPAWPTFAPRAIGSRRTRATTSCEVTPAGFARTSTPLGDGDIARKANQLGANGPGRALQLGGDLRSDEVDQLAAGLLGGEPGRLAVAAAALLAGDHAHVDVVGGRPEADLADALAAFLELLAYQRRDDCALDGADVVHDPLGIVLVRPVLLIVGALDVRDREVAVVIALNGREHARQQLQLRERHVLVEAAE